MKKITTLLIAVAMVLGLSVSAYAIPFFPTGGVDIPTSASNQLGMAVDQNTGHIFITTLSYHGEDNLWEYASDGTLLHSTRAAIDTGITGNLSEIVVGKNGHLFTHVSKGVMSGSSLIYEQSIVELSQDGSQVFSSHPAIGGYDLAYDYNNDQILITTQGPDNSYVSENFGIVRTDLTGNVINSSTQLNVAGDRDPAGLAYNSNNNHLFAAFNSRLEFDGDMINFMVEYEWNSSDLVFEELAFYDLESITPSGLNTLDFNNSSNLFYLGHNGGVFEFALDQLTQFTPISYQSTIPLPTSVPEPSTLLLLGSGLAGLGYVKRRFKK